jgi:hypothetical protein
MSKQKEAQGYILQYERDEEEDGNSLTKQLSRCKIRRSELGPTRTRTRIRSVEWLAGRKTG